MKLKFGLRPAALAMLLTASGYAAELKVIVNSAVSATSISSGDLKDIFLANKSALSDGTRVASVLLKAGTTHTAFVQKYVGRADSAYDTYLRSLVFTGKASMPKALAGDAEMVGYVAKNKGAIGYVSAAADTTSVKVLDVK